MSADDYTFMLPEQDIYYNQDLEITIKIFKSQNKKTNFEGQDIFKIPEFWLGKGCLI